MCVFEVFKLKFDFIICCGKQSYKVGDMKQLGGMGRVAVRIQANQGGKDVGEEGRKARHRAGAPQCEQIRGLEGLRKQLNVKCRAHTHTQ